MTVQSTHRRTLAGLAAVVGALALAVPIAQADPPNRPRGLPQAQAGLTHVPEIVSGITATPEGRPSPEAEITAGFASPSGGVQVLASQGGFSWDDAGVGAAAALGAAALAGACALAIRRRVPVAH